MKNEACPCGSQQPYSSCCGPLHEGGRVAATPEALMRSRFAAFATHKPDYLLLTWHPKTRPSQLDLKDAPVWTSLQILDASQTGPQGAVHFRAIYWDKGQWGYLEERSDFAREDGQWLYVSGDPRQGLLKPGRNDRCPCGSGRKYKACCINRDDTKS
ncbi:YchJ family protein [Marinobacter fonticola]|uniref:YchJ family protein n=1 Tax=Marinobacter fonticola TaxID=2603215 RepID=UPI0011E6CA5C|nr:YchJ family protein [Marinobacter fonticola]